MGLVRAVIVALMLALSPSVTTAAEVSRLDWRAMDQWLAGSTGKATTRFSNNTIQINVTRRALGNLKGGPQVGPLIMYLGKGGNMLAWTAKGKVVGTGRWDVVDMRLANILCFYFDGPKGRSECFWGGSANYVQITAGNVFHLIAGEPVPTRLSGRDTIQSLIHKLGL